MPEWMFFLDDVSSVCNQYCMEFWALVGNWVAGLGTVAAVVVSLYLARQDQRIQLRVSAVIGAVIGDPEVDPDTDHVWVQVRNVGRRAATLKGIGWRFGIFPRRIPKIGRRHGWQMTNLPNCTPTPVRLDDGATASFMIPLEGWLNDYASKALPRPFWLTRWFVFIEAYSSTGEAFSRRVDRALCEKICAAAHAQIQKAPAASTGAT